MKLYAEAKGRKTGIFDNWEECQESTKAYPDAKFMKFNNYQDAEKYIAKFGNEQTNHEYLISCAAMNIVNHVNTCHEIDYKRRQDTSDNLFDYAEHVIKELIDSLK